MNDLVVITGCTSPQRLLPAYIESVQRAGIDMHVESGLVIDNMGAGGAFGWGIEFHRRMVRQFSHYQKIVITDAFDVLFYGTKEDALRKIPDDYVLLAGEKNCYPNPGLREGYPGSTPWRFVNGGMLAGSPQAILAWYDRIVALPEYRPTCLNQELYNNLVHAGADWFHIDERTELFFCLFGGYEELEFENGIPVNTLCGTKPNFIHLNGHWDGTEMFKKYERSLAK